MTQISVPNTDPIILAVVGAVVQTTFNFTLPFFENADIKFYVGGVLKIEGVDYVLTPTGGFDDGYPGGSIEYAAGAQNTTVIILRDVEEEFSAHFPGSGPFSPLALNVLLMRLWAAVQEANARIDRTIRVATFDSLGTMAVLADVVGRANTFVAFDSAGDLVLSAGVTGQPVAAAWLPVIQAVTIASGLTAAGFSTFIQTLLAIVDLPAFLVALGLDYLPTEDDFDRMRFDLDRLEMGRRRGLFITAN